MQVDGKNGEPDNPFPTTELLSAEAIVFLAVSFGLKSFRSHARFLLSLDKFEPTKKEPKNFA
ncbi:MAG: hypothetical protein CMN21_19535 [Rubinisphaera sp.]|nr:hypothetical protein [Rubinisphaera sp.]|tara:strand:- start:2209 stop:2394 length:186 start_codon:yes stop_codon:yes gene_type:complete